MGLSIGIPTVSYIPRPRGEAYWFAWELCERAGANGMYSDGQAMYTFTQRDVIDAMIDYTDMVGKTPEDRERRRSEILHWVKTLPWQEWEDDISTLVEGYTGGEVELFFDW